MKKELNSDTNWKNILKTKINTLIVLRVIVFILILLLIVFEMWNYDYLPTEWFYKELWWIVSLLLFCIFSFLWYFLKLQYYYTLVTIVLLLPLVYLSANWLWIMNWYILVFVYMAIGPFVLWSVVLVGFLILIIRRIMRKDYISD